MAWSMHIDAKSLCMRKHTKMHPVQAMAWSMNTGAKSLCMRKRKLIEISVVVQGWWREIARSLTFARSGSSKISDQSSDSPPSLSR